MPTLDRSGLPNGEVQVISHSPFRMATGVGPDKPQVSLLTVLWRAFVLSLSPEPSTTLSRPKAAHTDNPLSRRDKAWLSEVGSVETWMNGKDVGPGANS